MRRLRLRNWLPVLSAAFLFAAPAEAQRPARGIPHLLIPGSPYDGDAAQVTGQRWLGVYRARGGLQELRPTTVRIVRGENGCFDTKVVTPDSTPPLFLIGGVPALRAGPVDTVFNGYRFLFPGESVSWQLPGGWFVLRAAGTATPHSTGTSYTGYELQLGTSSDRYSLIQTMSVGTFGDNTPTIRWAGDLDGDGRLDLLLELPDAGYSDVLHLFLSSAGSSSTHVGEVGRLYQMDC